jgi:alginate O-acetyltransferase complex protein AlgI
VPQIGDGPGTDLKKDVFAGAERIVHGLFKKFVLVQLVHPYVLTNQTQALSGLSPGAVLLGLYAYALYFYFDFSGYSDLAIGSARLLGVQLPENFNNPFLKKNIRELWTNWHMSLTAWLVDYIYWPLVRKFRDASYLRERPVLLSNVGMMITFIGCGMWHGEAVHFLIWGAYHGLGISALTIYQRQKRKIRNPFLQRYFRSRFSAIAGTFFTFNFFALGLAFFVLDLNSLKLLLESLL